MNKNIIPLSLALSLVATSMAQNEKKQAPEKQTTESSGFDILEQLFNSQFPDIPETTMEHVQYTEDTGA